jgi:hypothetical protein
MALVVSTVGAMFQNRKLVEVGPGRHYETLAFWVDKDSGEYKDADVDKEIFFESECGLKWPEGGYPNNEANDMHEDVVAELSEKLEKEEL